MSYRLLCFVGHFVHDGDFAAIHIDEKTGLAIPKLKLPICEDNFRQSAIEFCGGNTRYVARWNVKFERGYVAFGEFSDAKALAWLGTLASTTNVDVIEGGTMRVVLHSELRSMTASES